MRVIQLVIVSRISLTVVTWMGYRPANQGSPMLQAASLLNDRVPRRPPTDQLATKSNFRLVLNVTIQNNGFVEHT